MLGCEEGVARVDVVQDVLHRGGRTRHGAGRGGTHRVLQHLNVGALRRGGGARAASTSLHCVHWNGREAKCDTAALQRVGARTPSHKHIGAAALGRSRRNNGPARHRGTRAQSGTYMSAAALHPQCVTSLPRPALAPSALLQQLRHRGQDLTNNRNDMRASHARPPTARRRSAPAQRWRGCPWSGTGSRNGKGSLRSPMSDIANTLRA